MAQEVVFLSIKSLVKQNCINVCFETCSKMNKAKSEWFLFAGKVKQLMRQAIINCVFI